MKKPKKTPYSKGIYTLDRKRSTSNFRHLLGLVKKAKGLEYKVTAKEFNCVEFYSRRKLSLNQDEIWRQEIVLDDMFSEVFKARELLEDLENTIAKILGTFEEARVGGPDEEFSSRY
jgi:hypothetical protein